jgi:biotin-(acetyl-CoA carboxylase) ligase
LINIIDRLVSLGAGLNVANSKPTVCLNSLLPADHAPLTVEETLAEIINKFERNLACLKFQFYI